MTRTVVITGACGGIGSAVVRTFDAAGWRTVGLDRNEPDPSLGLHRFLRCDVAEPDQLIAAIAKLANEPRVDALVNNAATAMDRDFEQLSIAEWDLTMATNVRPAFVLAQGLLQQLTASSGAVVNVASVHAVATTRGVTAYAASKGALVAFTRAASLDLACRGVRCNVVCPGATDTLMLHAGMAGRLRAGDGSTGLESLLDRTPLGRVGTPIEIAQAVLFLADGMMSGFMTGQSLIVDGGATTRLGSE